ncbi:hypothetical protein [Kineosporia babensis]|uniref:Uncharacterized protein n=1 Tax=Kineosporia babensis TaxID=499548 RepID=A0A9X1SUQ1_9ACTN|nr:hypothetical protein [Kineosporia babensis]MCD5312686.1 hypothetical protein [Kineosporia babensis]
MDEVEYRMRDLDAIADHAGRLPSAAELRRRGERKRTTRRIGLGVATFGVVALVAGGATTVLHDSSNSLSGTPSGTTAPLDPEPTASSSTPSDAPSSAAAAPKTDQLSEAAQYWIWAPPLSDGKRMLNNDWQDRTFDLERSSKDLDPGGGPNWRGQWLLQPVEGSSGQWQIVDLVSSEADTICMTVLEGGIAGEACDPDDEKQAFQLELTADEQAYSIYSVSRKAYLVPGSDRTVEWSDSADGAGVWSFEQSTDT